MLIIAKGEFILNTINSQTEFVFDVFDVIIDKSISSAIATQKSRAKLREFVKDIYSVLDGEMIDNVFSEHLPINRIDTGVVYIHFSNTPKLICRLNVACCQILSLINEVTYDIDLSVITLPNRASSFYFFETISFIIGISQIANTFVRKGDHILIMGLQKGNMGIDISYMVLDTYDEISLANTNIIEAEIKASFGKTQTSFTIMHTKESYRGGGLPTNVGRHAISTFHSSNNALLDLVDSNSLLAYTFDGAIAKKTILENLQAVIIIWCHPGSNQENWINEELTGTIPYKQYDELMKAWIIRKDGDSEINYQIPKTSDIIANYSQHMKINLNGEFDVVIHPYLWDSNQNEWIEQTSKSGSPFFDIANFFSGKICSLYNSNLHEIIECSMSGNWFIDKSSGLRIKYNRFSDTYSVSIAFWNGNGVNLCVAPVVQGVLYHHHIILDELYSLNDMTAIFHAIVARMAKGICDNLKNLSSDVAKEMLGSKRISVFLNKPYHSESVNEPNIFDLYDKAISRSYNNGMALAYFLKMEISDEKNEFDLPSNSRNNEYYPSSRLSINPYVILDLLIEDLSDILDNTISQASKDIDKLNPKKAHSTQIADFRKLIALRKEVFANMIAKTHEGAKYRKPNILFMKRTDNLIQNPRKLTSETDKLTFYYYWNAIGRGFSSSSFKPSYLDSINIVKELKRLLPILTTKDSIIRHGASFFIGSFQTSILPKYGHQIVGLKKRDHFFNLAEIRDIALTLKLTDEAQQIIQDGQIDDILRYLNMKIYYNQLSDDQKDKLILIRLDDINGLMEILKGETPYQKMFNLRASEAYILPSGHTLLGEHFIRTSVAGEQYLYFRNFLTIAIEENYDLMLRPIREDFLAKSMWSQEYLDLYMNSFSNQKIVDFIEAFGYRIPRNYNDLINLLYELSYGEYMEFMLSVQLLDYYKHMNTPNSPIGILTWFGLIGKIQSQIALIRAGVVPADAYTAGQLELLAMDTLLMRFSNGAIAHGFPDPDLLYSFPLAATGVGNSHGIFEVSDKVSSKYQNKFTTSSPHALLAYIMTTLRKSDLSYISEIDKINNNVTNALSKMAWPFERFLEVPRWSRWKHNTVSELRGVFNPKHATPVITINEAEWVRLMNAAYSQQFRVYALNMLKLDWYYLWNCIYDAYLAILNSNNGINGRIINKELRLRVPTTYFDHSLILLRRLLIKTNIQ